MDKSKKKKITIIVVVSVVAAILIAGAIVAIMIFGGKNKKTEISYDKSSLKGVETDESIVAWMTYDENSSQENLIKLAAKAYDNACKLDQNCEFRRYDVICGVTTVGTVMQYVTQIKNGEEFYRSELQIPDPDSPPIFKTILKSQTYFLCQYATLSQEKMIEINTEKGITRYDDGTYEANLNEGTVEYKDKPYYNATQEQKYRQTDFVVEEDTIKNVSITHNDEEGYYTLVFDIDVDNEEAIAKPYENLSKSVDGAKYTSVHETVEIWDSGYFRSFCSYDQWSGKVMVDIDAVIDYQTYFIYDKEKCDINACYGIEKLREEIVKQ